ncbi:LysR family transcriptional regulator [Psychromonas sp. Urea-02u-13]|uniref:LysR family transcriptional regulator n=1 Tax=Psychromonas sp. Urea-02u-13 TaxID=2058326 RepID=UPI000C329AE7|nr:LysR family transcriptional regulator [Psychromonas sp. Urea-02u-13]PKG40611.1 LysR family transcriptional regulator [Psychromonas sp. Urea-02u-13]
MIEPLHLKIMIALDEKGTLTQAADALFLTQSALSHQIRHLEKKLNVKLWQRCGRRLRLTPAGQLLLKTAHQVIPTLLQTEQSLKAMGEGQQGLLRIGVECFPCHEWLTNVVAHFLTDRPNIDVDIIRQFQFSGLEGLVHHHVDLLITPDVSEHERLLNVPLFEYEQVLLVANEHPLAAQSEVFATQLQNQVLFTFPIEKQRLDIFNQFLWPENIEPKMHKQIESVAIMLQMVAHQRGVCVLPEWLADSYAAQYKVSKLRLGKQGVFKTLYAVLKKEDQNVAYIEHFIELGNKVNANTQANVAWQM